MEKRLIGLLLISLILTGVFVGLVSAQFESLNDGIRGFFGAWTEGGIDNFRGGLTGTGFVKLLVLILITLLVFSILDSSGFFGSDNRGVLFVVSLIVGILSTFFMNQYQILDILNLYNAFGGALITLTPFVIIGAFTWRAIVDGNPQLMVFQHIAWGLFALFLGVSLYAGNFNSLLFGWGVFIIAVVLTFRNSAVLDFFEKRLLKAKALSAAKSMGDIERGIKLFKRAGNEASGSS